MGLVVKVRHHYSHGDGLMARAAQSSVGVQMSSALCAAGSGLIRACVVPACCKRRLGIGDHRRTARAAPEDDVSATTCHCRAALPLSQLRALDGSDKEADQAREKLAAVQAELASALAKADEHGTRWRKAADELRATEVRARHLWALRRRLASARAAPMLGVRIRIHHLFAVVRCAGQSLSGQSGGKRQSAGVEEPRA